MLRIVPLVAVATIIAASAVAPATDNKSGAKQDKPIAWRTDAVKAYSEALEKSKPLVLVFVCPLDRDTCVHCKKFRGALFSAEMQKFADDAVFAIADIRPDRTSPDKTAETLFSKLDMKATPSITILEPNRQLIEERVRLNGYFAADQLVKHFDDVLRHRKAEKPQAPKPPAVGGTRASF